jgi:sulfur-oxidizing protein SoxY
MNRDFSIEQLSRRRFVVALTATGALAAGLSALPLRAGRAEAAPSLDEAIKKIVGDKEIMDGADIIALDLPQIAENGNTVPLGVAVESPMTAEDHVTAVHLFAPGNPRPEVASFHFTPKNGRAEASTRMRLAKTQDVVAIAEMSTGKTYATRAEVKVTIGGCGG